MSITRRLFIRNTAAVGAVGAAVATPAAVDAAPERTPHEQALWHIRELERLVFEDGALDCHIFVGGHYSEYIEGRTRDVRAISLHRGGLVDKDGLFAAKGGEA